MNKYVKISRTQYTRMTNELAKLRKLVRLQLSVPVITTTADTNKVS